MRRSHSVSRSASKNRSRLMFSLLFRNQISTQNSTDAGKYFHKSEAELEHTSTSERELRSGWLEELEKVSNFFEEMAKSAKQCLECMVMWCSFQMAERWAGMHIPAWCTFSLCFFIYTPPAAHTTPSLTLSLPQVYCHWAEITPVLLAHLGTRVKHTQGETWWGSFAESH